MEFDHDGDGIPDGSAGLDSEGSFTYRASSLPREVSRSGRAPWDGMTTMEHYVYGSWTSETFDFDPQAPEVTLLELANPSDTTLSPPVAVDPTVLGIVSSVRAGSVLVEFDHDGDDVVDGVANAGYDGSFMYAAEGLAPGQVTMRARAVEADEVVPACALYYRTTALDFIAAPPLGRCAHHPAGPGPNGARQFLPVL